jgi:glycosyltransferase involved in cell wall biosynthesis
MTISVVIPAFNSEALIHRCLAACLAQEYSKHYEVIVVDDGSADQTGEIVKQTSARYIHQQNRGPAAARNTGWKHSQGDIICFTDADCAPEPEWLQKVNDVFKKEDPDAVGGSYTYTGQSGLGKIIQQEIEARHGKIQGPTDFLGSFNLAVKRSALKAAGGFNEDYKSASGEDNDLCYRLRKAGYKLWFDRDILVEHMHPWNFYNYLISQARHGFWRIKLYKDHPGMAKGDDYAGLRDFILPPLSILAVLILTSGRLLYFFIALILLIILSMRRDPGLAYIIFIRSFFRGSGMVAGLVKFWVIDSIKNVLAR